MSKSPTDTPLRIGSYLGLLTGIAILGLGLYSMSGAVSLPMPLVIALLITGLSECVLSWYTLARNRVAWAFAMSLNGTLALVLLFAAPKIRDAADISIALALLPALLGGVLVIFFSLGTDDF